MKTTITVLKRSFLAGLLAIALAAPARAQSCAGDCDGNGVVTIADLLVSVQVALETAAPALCPAFDPGEPVSVADLLRAVRNALDGCRFPATLGELIAGEAGYVDGTFVWTDYAYDDHGANVTARTGGDRTRSAFAGGDTLYPPEAAPGNVADLIQLQIGLRGGALTLRAVLETLVDPDLPVLAVGFDTDAQSATGAATLPGSAWEVDGALGVEVLLVLSSAGGEIWRFADGAWHPDGAFAVAIDTEANSITATIARAALDPQRATWRAVAALGIATAAGTWLDGAAPIFDLAFVGGELLVRWQENDQADILAGALTAERAVASIDFARVADRVDQTPSLEPGFHTFLYRSTLTLPEGVAAAADNTLSFLGPYQPYAVYLPAQLPSPTPLSVFLHGLSQNHLGSVFIGAVPQTYLGTGRALSEDPYTLFPQFSQDGFDFPPATLQVLPLGRGQGLFYRGIGHQDVRDVLADALQRFDVDPDRISLQGASMGGIGTYRIGALEPDRWSAIAPLIGFQVAGLLPLSANLLNTPVRQINGVVDPLIAEAPATASAARLDELGYDYRYWLIDGRGHEAGGFIYDCVFGEIAALRRNPNPPHVVYSVDPSLDEIDPASGLALRFDRAYWVSGLRVREPGLGTVDATSLALPSYAETVTRIDERRDNLASGYDLCGPNPAVQTGETWRERGIAISRGVPRPGLNALNATLTNLAAVEIDLPRAGIDVGRTPTITVASDGPVAVTLSGLPAGMVVLAGGGPAAAAGPDGRATVELTPGSHDLRLASGF
ncbi:MAG: hypothetical protein ACRERC_19530 [Candidatus Binatia bacterium]